MSNRRLTLPRPQPTPPQPPPPPPRKGYFPKRGETLELTCEGLTFKGKGVCKVAGSTFVLLCDGALPGERLLARVRRLRGGVFAEAAKLRTLKPHHDAVEAPCPLTADCGGCKTQSLAYAAQIQHKYLQVRDLLVNFGKFDPKNLESSEPDAILKPIVPCDEIFRYRNKMEFSFGTKRWMQREWKGEKEEVVKGGEREADSYALGLHEPGFFDKVLHVEKCLLQSEPTDKVLAVVQESCMDPSLGLTPYNVHKHIGFLKHLMIRTGRDISTGAPEVMVNFVTSYYKPELLAPLVNNITKVPEVGHMDVELNEIGMQQAIAVARWMSKEAKPTAIYSSDLKRAVVFDPALRERRIGDLQGLKFKDAATERPEAYQAFMSHKRNQQIPQSVQQSMQLACSGRPKCHPSIAFGDGDDAVIFY